MITQDFLIPALEIVLCLNILVSIAVAFSRSYMPGQKIAQIALVWILPVLGVLAIGLFLVSQGGGRKVGNSSNSDLDSRVTWIESSLNDSHRHEP